LDEKIKVNSFDKAQRAVVEIFVNENT